MKAFLDSIKLVTGPLTLLAFLAVVALAVYLRSVKDRRGLEFLYKLLREKLTREQFYALASNVIGRTFWFMLVVFIAALAAFVGEKALTRASQKTQNISGNYIEANGSNAIVVSGTIHGDVNFNSRGAVASREGNTLLAEPGTAGTNQPVKTTTGGDGSLILDPPSGTLITVEGYGNVVNTKGEGNVVLAGANGRTPKIRNPRFIANPLQRKSAGLRIDFAEKPGGTDTIRNTYSLRPMAREFEDTGDGEPYVKPHPPGSYGFTASWIIQSGADLDRQAWSRRAAGAATLEVHKRPGGEIALAGYVTESEARSLANKEIDSPLETTLYIRTYETSSFAVAIPLGRIEMIVLKNEIPKNPELGEPIKGDPFDPARMARIDHEMGHDRIILIVR